MEVPGVVLDRANVSSPGGLCRRCVTERPPSLRHNLAQRLKRRLNSTRQRPPHSGFVQVGFSEAMPLAQ
jgi:hypothetical protein